MIVGIRDDEQAPAALRERAAALMDTIDRYKELNNHLFHLSNTGRAGNTGFSL